MLLQLEDHYKKNFTTLVKRIAFRCDNNFYDAEDIVQEAYLRAIKYKEAFTVGLPFDFWFKRILSNSLKDFKRAQKAMGTVEEIEEEHLDPVEDPCLPSEVKRSIQKEIDFLQQPQREVVELHIIYGYGISQVSQITDVKYKDVNNIIQRFKAKMKEKYMQ